MKLYLESGEYLLEVCMMIMVPLRKLYKDFCSRSDAEEIVEKALRKIRPDFLPSAKTSQR